jgi:hypothetical protein
MKNLSRDITTAALIALIATVVFDYATGHSNALVLPATLISTSLGTMALAMWAVLSLLKD